MPSPFVPVAPGAYVPERKSKRILWVAVDTPPAAPTTVILAAAGKTHSVPLALYALTTTLLSVFRKKTYANSSSATVIVAPVVVVTPLVVVVVKAQVLAKISKCVE